MRTREELNKEDKQNNLNAEIRFSIKVVLNLTHYLVELRIIMTIYSLNTLISVFTEVPAPLTTIVSVAGFPQQFTLTIASMCNRFAFSLLI